VLLPGVALLTVSTANRFGQIQAEFHRLLDHPDTHAQIVARSLVVRARLYRDALASLYASVGLFALGSLLGGVINLWRPESLWLVGGLTIAGIAAIVFSAVQLLRESLLSLQVVREQNAAIQETLEGQGAP
jgi:O-antigen ligase